MGQIDIGTIKQLMERHREESRQALKKFAVEHGVGEVDEDAIRELGSTRRPLVLVRGKPITAEQAKMLVAGEEPLFGDGRGGDFFGDPREDRGVLKNIFYRKGFDWLSTWVYSVG